MAKEKCSECGAIFDGPDVEVLKKNLAAHIDKNHANKSEAILAALKDAKAMAFGLVNGATPTRKKARALVTDISKCLSEPIPDMPDEEEEKKMVIQSAKFLVFSFILILLSGGSFINKRLCLYKPTLSKLYRACV